MAFIIKEFDKYSRWDREHATYTFSINDNMYAVMKVRMEWGLPQVPMQVEYDEDLGIY